MVNEFRVKMFQKSESDISCLQFVLRYKYEKKNKQTENNINLDHNNCLHPLQIPDVELVPPPCTSAKPNTNKFAG